MSCVNSSCCCCHGSCHPVSTSQKAICAAHCATVGTNDTINALIVNGSHVLTAIGCDVTQAKKTAVNAQTQIAQSTIYAGALLVLGILAVVAFLWAGRKP
jgi:hypothetical protein